MCWFPKPDDPGVVCVGDAGGTFTDPGLSLDYMEPGGLQGGRAVHGAKLSRRVVNDKVSLRDYDFRHPQLDLAAEAGGPGALEWYESSGGFSTPDGGRELAAIRLAERTAEEIVLEGEATAPDLQAGSVFTVSGAPVEGMNGRWLAVSAHVTRN